MLTKVELTLEQSQQGVSDDILVAVSSSLSGISRLKIDEKAQFELKGQFLKELRDNTFSGSDNEDENEHIEKVLEIVDLFHIPNITQDQGKGSQALGFGFGYGGKRSFIKVRDAEDGSYTLKDLDVYSIGTTLLDDALPTKQKDPGIFTLPCNINNFYFNKSLADLGASINVMPFSAYTILGLGKLAPTKLIVELADRTVKCPKGIAENVLVRIDKKIPLDFVLFDMLEHIKTPLILGRPFLSFAHAKIEVFKRKITLRVGNDKIVFKSDKPASNIIKRVYELSLRERMELDLKFSCMIGYEHVNANFFPLLSINVMSKNFYNSIMKDKAEYKGKYIVRAFMNLPIFDGKFSVMTDFVVMEDMDSYQDEGMGDIIVGRPFCKETCVKARGFDGIITIYKGDDSVGAQDKLKGISHPYQKLKGFYKEVSNLGSEYINDDKVKEWLIRGLITAASAIAISSDSLDESMGSPPSRVILFGDIPTIIPSTSVVVPETSTITLYISSAAPVVETTLVASPTRLCGLVPYSGSDSDSPDEMSSPEHISPLPGISPFLCTYSSEAPDSSDGPPSKDPYVMVVARWRSKVASRPSSSEFPIAPVTAPPGIRRRSSLDSSPVYSSGLDAPDQAHFGSSTRDIPPRLCYPPRRAPRRSKAFRRWCAAPLSTLYPLTTSESSSRDSSERPLHSSSHSAGLSRKRCRSPVDSVPLSTPVMGSLAHTRADLLPPRKRFRDSYSSEASIEEDTKIDPIETEVDMELGIGDGDDVRNHVEIDPRDVRDDTEEYEADTGAGETVKVGIDPMSAPIVEEEIVEPAGEDSSDSSGTRDGIVRSFKDMPIDLNDAVCDFYHHMSEVRIDRIVGIKTVQRRLEADQLIDWG
ncbi:reverse transcriptase domain-containing protein [Tanacetum coccineum]